MWPGCYRAEERLDPGKTRRGVAAERTKGKGWGWGTPWGCPEDRGAHCGEGRGGEEPGLREPSRNLDLMPK